MFKYITPIIYWLLIIFWFMIFIIYVKRIVRKKITDKLVLLLIIILLLDAFRTLFESTYFGVWYTSLSGLIDISFYNFLAQPQFVFIPKILNLVISIVTMFIILKKWIPEETNRLEGFKTRESLNDLILSKIPVSVLITDAEGNIEYVNSQFCSLTGYKYKEVIGKNPDILQSGLTPRSTYDDLWATIRQGREWVGYFTNKKKTGELYYESARIKPLFDSDNNIINYLAIKEDITKTHEIELEKKILLDAIEQFQDSVEILDVSGKISYVNNTYLYHSGLNKNQVIGSYSKEFIDDNGIINNELIRSLLSGKFYSLNNSISMTTRGNNVEDISISPIFNELGEVTNFATIRKDTTDNFNIKKEKQALNEQVNQMQRIDSLGQLVGGVAHDFNNILTGITSSVELLLMKSKEFNGNHLKYIEMIKKSSDRAVELTKQLLKFSRKHENVKNSLSLNSIVKEAVSLLKQTINKSIKLDVINDTDNDFVLGNFSTLESIFLNLGINSSHSIKEEGIITYHISNIDISDDFILNNSLKVISGKYCLISVTDTGCGIPDTNINQIFDPFFTTKTVEVGTGLGLTSSLQIIQEHKGFILVNSKVGEGTCFKLYFPVDKIKEISPSSEKPISIGGAESILFVDDEELNRTLGKELLESIGYTVTLASNGQEAIDIYSNSPDSFNLVLLDIIMPGLGGKEVFIKLKELNPKCTIIIMSGYIHDTDLSELEKKGLNGFVKKPFTIRQLDKAIKTSML
ncbi:MAG: PAS domain S-box protein [Spirochaetaceae bacterium]